MNKKRKILTLVALAVFSVIIMLHYVPVYQHSYNSYLVEKDEQNSSKQIREYFLVRDANRADAARKERYFKTGKGRDDLDRFAV